MVAFAAALTVAEYTHLFSVLFVSALCVAAVLQRRLTWKFICSTGLSVLCFVPWSLALQTRRSQNNWLEARSLGTGDHLDYFLRMISTGFFDSNTTPWHTPDSQALIICLALSVALVVMAIKLPVRTSVFLLSLLLVPVSELLWYSVAHHNKLAVYDRYWTPCFIVLPLCLAGVIALGINAKKALVRSLSMVSLVVCLGLGLFSCVAFTKTPIWHEHAFVAAAVARRGNQHEHPVLLFEQPPPPCAALTLC